jgi:hypothetical protein
MARSVIVGRYPDEGTCILGGGHEAAGSDFTLPHDVPAAFDYDLTPSHLAKAPPWGEGPTSLFDKTGRSHSLATFTILVRMRSNVSLVGL